MNSEFPTHSQEYGMHVRRFNSQCSSTEVLWIHGLGESGLCFESFVGHPHLNRWPHIVPDLHGYGLSLEPDSPFSIVETVDHLARWIQATQKRPLHVVGHSLGGVFALLLAERYPELICSLIDIDGNKSLDDCAYSGHMTSAADKAEAKQVFATLLQDVQQVGQNDAASQGYYTSLLRCDPATFYRHSIELVEFSKQETLARRLAALTIPKLYIAGYPGGASLRSLELLAKANIPTQHIADSGHWPFIDHPNQTADAIATFIMDAETQ